MAKEKEKREDKSNITFTIQGKKEDFNENEDNLGEEIKGETKTEKEDKINIKIIDEDEKINITKKEKEGDKSIRIKLVDVSKKFDLDFKKKETALARFLSLFSREKKREFYALDNINLIAKSGENIGIIGKNGSGKSTLLRVISEIYTIDEGIVETNGQLVYLTGFGQGLKPKLTMRENIHLCGSIMGLGQPDIKKRFDEIVEFSGLNDYVDTKVYKFSSGMVNRLATSIGLHCLSHRNPDILLIDEVLAGGDIDFQDKAIEKMEELLKGGATVIFVSHSLDAIKKYCDKVIWLDKGKIRMEGNPEEVIKKYEKS